MTLVLALLTGLTACRSSTAPTPASAAAPTPPAEPAAMKQADGPNQADVLLDRDDRVIRVLPNRMVLVAQRVPTAPVVSAQVWVKTGSLYEQEHVGAGLSHFLEHLLSGGSTSNRTEEESNAVLGRIGAQTNAATSLDTVRYYINTTAEHRAEAVELLSDWMKHSVVSDAEYERERGVIQREFSMGDGDPRRIFWKLTQRARFAGTPDHPGAHPTIGYLDEFLTISRDEIYDFYRRMYVPNNMVFVVAGDIDPRETVEQMSALWQDVPAGPLPDLAFPVEPEAAPTVTVEGYADIARPRVRLLWRGVELASEHDFALDLLATILGQGESSRLVRELREEQRLVTSIDAYNFSATWGPGFFGIDFQPADGVAIEAAADAALAELDRLRSEPVTDSELARAKRKVLAAVLKSGQSAQQVAQRLASDLITTGDPDYLRRYADAVQSVRAEDLMAAANAVLPQGKHSSIVMRPVGDTNPVTRIDRPATAEASNDEAESNAFDLDNRVLIDELKSALANPLADPRPITVGEPVKHTLHNGLTVIAQRNTVVPAVAIQVYTLGGLLSDEPGREGVGNATQTMLDRGAHGRSAEQLANALEDLGASLSTGAGNSTAFVTASALAEDLPAVLGIVGDVVLRPDFPASEWETLRPRLLAAIDQQEDRWIGELRGRFRERYFGQHPWSQTTLGRRGVVESLTPDQLRSTYFSRLRAERSVVVVVGDVDSQRAVDLVEAEFDDMPGDPGTAAFAPPKPTTPSPGLLVSESVKPITVVQIGFGPTVSREHPDYPALQVLGRLVSAFPSGWLDRALRGDGPGLVYAVSAGNMTGAVPGYFAALFNTSADSADEALARTVGVIDRARNELADQTDLERAKAKVLADEFRRRQTNADLATSAALDHLYGVDDPHGQRFRERVDALSAEDVQAIARKYLVNPVGVVVTKDGVDPDQLEAILLGEGGAPTETVSEVLYD